MKTTQLDIEDPQQLLAYLQQTNLIEPDERPSMQPLTGGVSNRTVLVERSSGEAWVIKQALEKLRVAVDWFSSPERVHREAMGLRWLNALAPPHTIPSLVHEDHATHLLVMEAVPQPHANWKTVLLDGHVVSNHIDQFAQLLGTIHRRAYERRAEVSPAFADVSFFESLRLEPYYNYTAEQLPRAAGFLHNLIAETRQQRITLVHGDYSPKNILVYQDRLILLDHEVIHWGDPTFDVGFSLTHLLSKARHLPAHRSTFAAAAQQYWQVYMDTLNDVPWAGTLEVRAIQHTLACMLARVAGRSPLEYLDAEKRAQQQEAVLDLMDNPPENINGLIGAIT
ncbi:MAG: aminoglycoside phosphotransferase family protein [Candidatus Competibacteraceae bacterium]|jgi:fructosamine-3-kinase|nr:aminoglycoside phosphotransferase family protein [Candidatus Competibacteraceae bacterium]